MKFLIAITMIASLAWALNGEMYETKYDKVDWKAVMDNERLSRNYVDCLLDKKPCSNDGTYLKSIVSDALKTDCAKCSQEQRDVAKTILVTMYKKKPDWLKELQAVYDPDDFYLNKYKKELA